MRFGEMLRMKRLQMGWTQQQLGDRIGRTKNNISQFERGAREPNLQQLILFSQLFHISVDALLHGVTPTEPRLSEPIGDEQAWYASARQLPVYSAMAPRRKKSGVDADEGEQTCFYYLAPTNEMRDARVLADDYLLVRSENRLLENRVLLMRFDKAFHLRIARILPDNRVELIARNPQYKTVVRAQSRIHVLGEVLRSEIDMCLFDIPYR